MNGIACFCMIASGTVLPLMDVVFGKFINVFNDFVAGKSSPADYRSEVNHFRYVESMLSLSRCLVLTSQSLLRLPLHRQVRLDIHLDSTSLLRTLPRITHPNISPGARLHHRHPDHQGTSRGLCAPDATPGDRILRHPFVVRVWPNYHQRQPHQQRNIREARAHDPGPVQFRRRLRRGVRSPVEAHPHRHRHRTGQHCRYYHLRHLRYDLRVQDV